MSVFIKKQDFRVACFTHRDQVGGVEVGCESVHRECRVLPDDVVSGFVGFEEEPYHIIVKGVVGAQHCQGLVLA